MLCDDQASWKYLMKRCRTQYDLRNQTRLLVSSSLIRVITKVKAAAAFINEIILINFKSRCLFSIALDTWKLENQIHFCEF